MNRDNLHSADFDAIRLRLASPEVIRAWSFGEVRKPETINYRTPKAGKRRSLCRRNFWSHQGLGMLLRQIQKIRYKGIVCDKCGVEVTTSLVRRERMGHIELAAPVAHIWFLRSVPSKVGLILDLAVQALEKVIYFASFIITHVDEEGKNKLRNFCAKNIKASADKLKKNWLPVWKKPIIKKPAEKF